MRLVPLRFALSRLASLLLVLACALPLHAQTVSVPAAGDIVVNEIMFGPPTGSSEYVELYNRSAKTIEVADLRLNDNAGGPGRLITGTSTLLAPGQYLVLAQSLTSFQATYPGVAALQPTGGWNALNNSGTDASVVKHVSGLVVDSVSYTVPPALVGRAYERIDPNGPSAASNFAPSTAAALGTPGAANSVVDTAAPTVTASTYDQATRTFSITFSEPVRAASVSASTITFSGSTGYTVEAASVTGTTATGALVRFASAIPAGAYTVTVQGVQDVVGNTMPSTPLPLNVAFTGARAVPGDVVVNEIMAAPPTGGTEYVEYYNRSNKTFNLSDFRFNDNTGTPRVLTTQPLALAPGGYAVVVQNLAAFQAAYPGVTAVQAPSWPALNNDADAAVLKFVNSADTTTVIDSVAYTSPPAPSGRSYERIDPTGPSVATNFAASTAAALGTPGAQNSVFAIDTAAPNVLTAVETQPQTVVVTFSEPLDPATVTPARFAVGGVAPASATLGPDGRTVTLVFGAPLAASQLSIAAGVRDLKGNAAGAATLAIGRAAVAGDLVVNEILYAPRASSTDNRPDQPEYVELYNRSDKPLTLNGLLLVGRADENGRADTTRLTTAPGPLPAGGYAVVYRLSGIYLATANPDSAFRAAFPSTPASAVLVPVRTTFTLPNDGGRVAVLTPQRVVLDDVTYSPRWHNSSLRDASGIALERRDPAAPSNEPTNWSSSPDPEGGTPGRRNALTLDPSDPNVPAEPGLTAEPSPFSPDGDGVEDVTLLRYRLSGTNASGTIRVRIFNVAGRLVRTLTAAQLAGPVGMLEWDGRDDDGRGLALGPYIVLLDSVDAQGGTTQSFRRVVTLARQL